MKDSQKTKAWENPSPPSLLDRVSKGLTIALFFSVLAKAFFCYRHGSSIDSFFFLNLDFSDHFSNIFDQSLIFLSVACSVIIWCKHRTYALVFLSLWFFFLSLFETLLNADSQSEFALLTGASRFLLPWAIILLDRRLEKEALFFLRISIGIVFFGHGLKACLQYPGFMDYLYYLFNFFTSYNPNPLQMKLIIKMIAFIDILTGIGIIFFFLKEFCFYMMFWGFVTALIRIPYYELGIADFLLRLPHFIIPFVLLEKSYSLKEILARKKY